MTSAAKIADVEPFQGMQFKERTFHIDVKEEERQIGLCGIDPALYRGFVDPTAFIPLAIEKSSLNGISPNGSVNMVQTIIQRRPISLQGEVKVGGEILSIQHTPRGRVMLSETWFGNDADGRSVVAKRLGVKTNPDTAGVRGAGERPQPVVHDVSSLKEIAVFKLIPEDVVAYGTNNRTNNPIHTDPEAAKRAGYRAPIIGGSQGVRHITAAIWRHFSPKEVDMDIYFRRPLFWDDTFSTCVEERGRTWSAACLVKDQKIAVEVKINHIA